MWNFGSPEALKQDDFSNTFFKSRYPGLVFGYENSRTKARRQITKNWCGSVSSQIKVPWSIVSL